MRKIVIKTERIEVQAELNQTKTAELVWENLPLEGKANLWGEEIYFEIPVRAELENGSEVVNKGDIGYWPPGKAICLFFGPTPISQGEEIRAASPVSIIGKIIDQPEILKKVSNGEKIRIEKAK
ncbi:MAG: cyclophilin-like fold protein [Candidatus Aminicenantia bacterium]